MDVVALPSNGAVSGPALVLSAATLPRTGLPDTALIWAGAALVAVSLVLAVTMWFRRG